MKRENQLPFDRTAKYAPVAFPAARKFTHRPAAIQRRLNRIIGKKYGIYVAMDGKAGWRVILYSRFLFKDFTEDEM